MMNSTMGMDGAVHAKLCNFGFHKTRFYQRAINEVIWLSFHLGDCFISPCFADIWMSERRDFRVHKPYDSKISMDHDKISTMGWLYSEWPAISILHLQRFSILPICSFLVFLSLSLLLHNDYDWPVFDRNKRATTIFQFDCFVHGF